MRGTLPEPTGASMAQNDTPSTTAPSSPHIPAGSSTQSTPGTSDIFTLGAPARQRAGTSGTSTPRSRPTTLDIPGLTKSKVSPDGRIAQRDVGAKLVIVHGWIASPVERVISQRSWHDISIGYSMTREFSMLVSVEEWLQAVPNSLEKTKSQLAKEHLRRPSLTTTPSGGVQIESQDASRPSITQPASVAKILLNGEKKLEPPATPPNGLSSQSLNGQSNRDRAASIALQKPDMGETTSPVEKNETAAEDQADEPMDHNASFFDPSNKKASQIREQVARETLDELLDFILYQGGSVGILDATNSTMETTKDGHRSDTRACRTGPQCFCSWSLAASIKTCSKQTCA